MRRIITAVTLGAALFAAAACSDTKANPSASAPAGSSASASSTPSTGASGGTAESRAVCDAVTKAITTFGTNLVTKAQQSGSALSDPAKTKKFLEDISKDYVALSSSVKAEAAKASDPKLRKALEDLAKAADTLRGTLNDADKLSKDPSKIQEVLFSAELTAASETVNSICGT